MNLVSGVSQKNKWFIEVLTSSTVVYFSSENFKELYAFHIPGGATRFYSVQFCLQSMIMMMMMMMMMMSRRRSKSRSWRRRRKMMMMMMMMMIMGL